MTSYSLHISSLNPELYSFSFCYVFPQLSNVLCLCSFIYVRRIRIHTVLLAIYVFKENEGFDAQIKVQFRKYNFYHMKTYQN